MDLLKLFRRPPTAVAEEKEVEVKPVFHKKYKTVVDFPLDEYSPDLIDWVHNNTGNRSVGVEFVGKKAYMAFEDENDALIFKIKFL